MHRMSTRDKATIRWPSPRTHAHRHAARRSTVPRGYYARDRTTTDRLIAGTHGRAHEYTVIGKHDNRREALSRRAKYSTHSSRDSACLVIGVPCCAPVRHMLTEHMPGFRASTHSLVSVQAVHPPELGQRWAPTRHSPPQRAIAAACCCRGMAAQPACEHTLTALRGYQKPEGCNRAALVDSTTAPIAEG